MSETPEQAKTRWEQATIEELELEYLDKLRRKAEDYVAKAKGQQMTNVDTKPENTPDLSNDKAGWEDTNDGRKDHDSNFGWADGKTDEQKEN